MKILLNDKVILEFKQVELDVFEHEILSENIEKAVTDLIIKNFTQAYKNQLTKLIEEWKPKLCGCGIDSIPIDENKLASLIIARKDYKNAAYRAAEDDLKKKKELLSKFKAQFDSLLGVQSSYSDELKTMIEKLQSDLNKAAEKLESEKNKKAERDKRA